MTDLRCAQLPAGMLDGLAEPEWPPHAQLHVALDDDGRRHVVSSVRAGRRTATTVAEGDYHAVQRVGRRSWRVPVTAFWQAHRDAAGVYSDLVVDWAQPAAGMTAWDLYGGVGVFAAALGDAVGESGRVLTVDTSRAATRAARAALADLPQVEVVTDSVRRALTGQRSERRRGGAGSAAVGCRARGRRPTGRGRGSARGAHRLRGRIFRPRYRALPGHGYAVEKIKVFDAFPLTHHAECVALLTRA